MKKLLFTIIFSVFASGFGYSQYYYIPFKNEGKNPGGLNKDGENPNPAQPGNWNSLWSGDGSSPVSYTANQSIPFAFEFNGAPVTDYKVSNAGIVTFSTSAAENLTSFSNPELPSDLVPDNSVCILGIKPISASGGYKSGILSKTFGEAPNRQHWIQFNFFGEANIANGWTYWSVVLEESSNAIYIVDMKTLCASGNNICNNNVKISAGIQIDADNAISIDGSPDLGAGNIATNIFDESDNSFYHFIPGTQPAKDLAALKVDVAEILSLTDAPLTISGTFMNQGTETTTDFDFAYQINDEDPVIANVSKSISKNNRTVVSHPTTWTPAESGSYKIAVWPVNVNGEADENHRNDTARITVFVASSLVERKSLHEVFTSSTCGPCRPGNQNTDQNIFPNRPGKFTVIKYQQNFPGAGDPYATSESVNRRGYYNVNSIPNMQVDGGWNDNASYYTLNLFDKFQSLPAYLEIEASHVVNFRTIDVNVTLKPLADFSNPNLRLFVAVNEKETEKNKKTNGETEFFHVMKKMLPNQNGTVIGNMTNNTPKVISTLSYTFPGPYRLPADGQTANQIKLNQEHSVEDFSNLEVVVFVQDIATGKVYQSAYSEGTLLGIDNPAKLKESFVVYPNPATGDAHVDFRLDHANHLDIQLYNSLGQMVQVIGSGEYQPGLNTLDFNVDGLNKGVYFIKISGKTFSSTQSIVVN
jgi:hypothetical protein